MQLALACRDAETMNRCPETHSGFLLAEIVKRVNICAEKLNGL